MAKEKVKTGKKPHRKTARIKKSDFYVVEGGKVTKKKKECPKCGKGIFMAEHKNRFTCGNCSYTEMKG